MHILDELVRALGIVEQYVFAEELAQAGAPMVGGNGVAMLGPP